MAGVDDFINVQRATYTDLADAYEQFHTLYDKRQWHQLTVALLQFVSNDGNYRGTNMLDLVENFVSHIERKLSQLRLVQILCAVTRQLTPSGADDELERAIAFLKPYADDRKRLGEEAYIVVLMRIATLRLAQEDRADETKKLLAEGKAALDALDGAEAVVYSQYYKAAAEYHKVAGPASAFYDNAILYLSYTPLDSLSTSDQQSLAQDMALSALLGEGVYNFGEVVQHPILGTLAGTENEWLIDLLKAFHRGDIDKFNTIVSNNRDAWDAQQALRMYEDKVKQKVALLCLMELASKRPATERVIPFADIATEAQMPLDQVEWLLMRAMSLGLVKGIIDEVDGVVEVTYIKPRVLDRRQIGVLKARLDSWGAGVKETWKLLDQHTEEITT